MKTGSKILGLFGGALFADVDSASFDATSFENGEPGLDELDPVRFSNFNDGAASADLKTVFLVLP
jgi:hypothetical protein